MRKRIAILCLASAVARADGDAAWDAARRAILAHEEGRSRAELTRVEGRVRDALGDPGARAAMESRLIALLGETATADGKRFICRQLSLVGSGACVPHLARLLAEPDLADMARFALEPIPDPAVDEALLAAWPGATDRQRAGLIASMGARRTERALATLEAVLSGPDETLADAAISAVERIGTEAALAVLTGAYAKVPAARRPRVACSAMGVAHAVMTHGTRGPAETAFLAFLKPDQPRAVRSAALQGLMALDGRAHLPRVLEILRSDGDDLQGLAAGLLREGADEDGVRMAVAGLPAMSDRAQALVVSAVAGRGGTAALPAALARVTSPDPALAAAALEAVGAMGGANEAGVLVGWLGDPGMAAGARAALSELRGAGVNEAMVRALKGRPAAVQNDALRILVARHAVSAVPALLALAETPALECREAVFRTVGDLADATQLPELAGLVVRARDGETRAAAGQALLIAAARSKDPARTAGTLLAAYPGAGADSRCALLRALRPAGTPEALALVRGELESPDDIVADTALRVLADWPRADPAEELMARAHSETNAARRQIAFRGAVGMAGRSARTSAGSSLRVLEAAWSLAVRTEDKWLVLGALMNVPREEALRLAVSCLDDPALADEASMAVLRIADAIAAGHPEAARAAVARVPAATRTPTIRKQAEALLRKLGPRAP
jgi:HEAT repeat protein